MNFVKSLRLVCLGKPPIIRETRLGVDRVKPWNSVRINLGLGLRGPDIRPGLDNRHLIVKDHRGLRR